MPGKKGTPSNLGSISPTFYGKLCLEKIPKAQKDTVYLTVIFALLGSAYVKALRKALVKLTLGRGASTH